MTNLIYRGATYVRTSKSAPRTPQDLIYRGVRHDGMTRESAPCATVAEMCYRGVSYTIAPHGRVTVEATPALGAAAFVS